MPFYGFHGGIHPPYHKHATSVKPTETLGVVEGDLYAIPLSQHIGAPAKPVVAKNQQVKAGEVIGESAGFVSANVHSSVDGVVVGLESIHHPVVGKVPGVIIKAGEQSGEIVQLPEVSKLVEAVLAGGIVGLGGATFPTHVKLAPPKAIDTLLINGAECEPYLTCDHRLMVEKTEEIARGIQIIATELGIAHAAIGIEKNKPDCIDAFSAIAERYNLEVVPLDVKYPQGGEKQLIKACVNRVVPEGKLPMEVGVIVQNVGTALAVFDAVVGRRPLIERVVTVTGAVKEPKNILARIGTPVSRLVAHCGGFLGEPRKVVLGGPMMGFSAFNLDTPVMKGTSGILVMRDEDLPDLKQRNCIRCGRCVDVCPMGLVPSQLELFMLNQMWDKMADWHLMNCIECGCCSYTCPSRRTLVGSFKTGKRFVANVLKQREQNAGR